MGITDERQKKSRNIEIRATFPKDAALSEQEIQQIVAETENEIVDSFTGDQAVSFIKAKSKEKTEIAISKAETKEKVII